MFPCHRGAAHHERLCFPPLAFYDCLEGRESGRKATGGGSLSNVYEAELVAILLLGGCLDHRQSLTERNGVVVLYVPASNCLPFFHLRIGIRL